jgi:hypothetical protein
MTTCNAPHPPAQPAAELLRQLAGEKKTAALALRLQPTIKTILAELAASENTSQNELISRLILDRWLLDQ